MPGKWRTSWSKVTMISKISNANAPTIVSNMRKSWRGNDSNVLPLTRYTSQYLTVRNTLQEDCDLECIHGCTIDEIVVRGKFIMDLVSYCQMPFILRVVFISVAWWWTSRMMVNSLDTIAFGLPPMLCHLSPTHLTSREDQCAIRMRICIMYTP